MTITPYQVIQPLLNTGEQKIDRKKIKDLRKSLNYVDCMLKGSSKN